MGAMETRTAHGPTPAPGGESAARVVFALATGVWAVDGDTSVEKVAFGDLLGGTRSEICPTLDEVLLIYGTPAGSGDFMYFGEITLGEGGTGGGCGTEGSSVTRRPDAAAVGGKRVLRLMGESVAYYNVFSWQKDS